MSSISFEDAVEVFVRGFQFTRSYTHPYLAERIAPQVWRLHDGPRKSGDQRNEEFVAWDTDAETIHRLTESFARGSFKVSAIVSDATHEAELRAGFKACGYRLMATEAFFVHNLQEIETVSAPYPIMQVTTVEQVLALAKATGRRQILPEHLTASPAPMRQYVAMDDDALIGWVGSIAACDSRWCSSMYVVPSHRRQGVARALLTRMLTDDKANGAEASILLASHDGAKLYPVVGYETIGKLFMFTPPNAKHIC